MFNAINNFTISINQRTLAPIYTWANKRWRPPPFERSLRELTELSKVRMDFYKFCEKHRIFDANIKVSQIYKGDTILVGPPIERCKSEYRNYASNELTANLDIADQILNYIQEKIPHSPNYLSRSLNASDPTHKEICENIDWKHVQAIAYSPDGFGFKLCRRVGLDLANKIKEAKLGVCEDLAHVGKLYAWEYYPDQRVEIAQIRPGRHTFLVINREEGSDLMNYKT